jgi:hypothetical protein
MFQKTAARAATFAYSFCLYRRTVCRGVGACQGVRLTQLLQNNLKKDLDENSPSQRGTNTRSEEGKYYKCAKTAKQRIHTKIFPASHYILLLPLNFNLESCSQSEFVAFDSGHRQEIVTDNR